MSCISWSRSRLLNDADEEAIERERIYRMIESQGPASLQESTQALLQQVVDWAGDDHLEDGVSALAIGLK